MYPVLENEVIDQSQQRARWGMECLTLAAQRNANARFVTRSLLTPGSELCNQLVKLEVAFTIKTTSATVTNLPLSEVQTDSFSGLLPSLLLLIILMVPIYYIFAVEKVLSK